MTGLKDLVYISHAVGKRQDYIQGGGGNTSVKLDDALMAIKASGSFLSELTEQNGFVALRYRDILDYHKNTPRNEQRDYNKEVMDVAIASAVQVNGEPAKRPSVEAGFHALLKRCVIHTHAVYMNVLMCSEGGMEKARDILASAGIKSVWVPCVKPGYYLTEAVIEALKGHEDADAVLIQNHGIIVHAEDAGECVALHEKANMAVKKALDLPDFPECAVQKHGEYYKSATPWLIGKMSDMELARACFETPLYPDQLVYLSGSGPDIKDGKIAFKDGEIIYRTGETEARAIEETLSGVAYVAYCIKKCGFTVHAMNEQDASYINNWDSEKYRKQMVN